MYFFYKFLKSNLKLCIIVTFFLTISCNSNDLLKTYSTEVSELKTEADIEAYWNTLYNLDQITYLKETKNPISGDSISLTNMMRTALVFEIHGTKAYKPNNSVPILNFTHNYIGDSNLAFWPIIQECKKVGGSIESFGGGFPAYQLEGISMSFYDYSLLDQNSEYPRLLKKLNSKDYNKVSTELINIIEQQNKLAQLKEVEVIGQWKRQPILNYEDNGHFEFVIMSDDNLYLRRKHRLQKLIETTLNDVKKTYRINNEPFGWSYTLENKTLSLIDDQDKTLIIYNSSN